MQKFITTLEFIESLCYLYKDIDDKLEHIISKMFLIEDNSIEKRLDEKNLSDEELLKMLIQLDLILDRILLELQQYKIDL